MKLDYKDTHLLRLTLRDKRPDGWTKVSAQVWPVVAEMAARIPELIEVQQTDDGGLCKLTSEGETVLAWS